MPDRFLCDLVELVEAGAPGIHFYVMSTAKHVVRVAEPLRKLVG